MAATLGCASWPPAPRQKPPLDAQAGLYKSVEIDYHIDAGRLTLPISVARIEGQQVSYDELPTRPEAGCAGGRITIRYPHSDGRSELAEVRLVIERDPRKPVVFWKPKLVAFERIAIDGRERVREEWRLDLAKRDLDELIQQLRLDGCFSREQPHAQAARLTFDFDGHRRTKPWSQSPPLERCMQRVRREGQLIALKRPATPSSALAMTSSLASYRTLVAEGGGGDPPSSAVAVSGLIMPRSPAATLDPAAPTPPNPAAPAANGPLIAANSPPANPPGPPTGFGSPLNPPNVPGGLSDNPAANAEVARVPGGPR